MISRRDLLVSLAAAPFLSGQDRITTEVKVVNIFATVHDHKGQIVRDLTKDDFSVEEENHPQNIKYFSKESDLPLTLGLVVDTSGSMRRVLDQERAASYKFFDQVLREDKDEAFLVHFDSEVELLQDLTSSRKRLQKSLSDLQVVTAGQLRRRDQDPGAPRPRGGTALYDAVWLAANDEMKKQKGRKAIVLLSDGEDNSSRETMTEAIAASQKADTLVYTILFADETGNRPGIFGGGPNNGRHGGGMGRYPQQGRVDGRKVMERLAKETGGGAFDGMKKSLDSIFAEIQEELRNQYSLGYTPDRNEGPGYRTIKVMTKQKNLVVQARDGYYADK